MSDSVLIQNGRAHQIWRGTAKASLPPMTAELLNAVVETAANAANEGDFWDGEAFTAPPAGDRIVAYSAFRALWTDAEKQALFNAMKADWRIDDFVGLARAQNSVNLTNATGQAAKAALVAASVLTQERADELFS